MVNVGLQYNDIIYWFMILSILIAFLGASIINKSYTPIIFGSLISLFLFFYKSYSEKLLFGWLIFQDVILIQLSILAIILWVTIILTSLYYSLKSGRVVE